MSKEQDKALALRIIRAEIKAALKDNIAVSILGTQLQRWHYLADSALSPPNIVEALKAEDSELKIAVGTRELLWHHGQWRVYDYGIDRSDPMLIATDDEEKAVEVLLEKVRSKKA